jgi:hypothetical protein
MTTSYLSDPNTARLATHCVLCQRPLRDAVSVNLGIGPICREELGLGDVAAEYREAANRAIHRAGIACVNPDAAAVAVILDAATEVEGYGLTVLADKIRTRYIPVQVWRAEAPITQWDRATRQEIVLPGTQEVVCVRTPYNPDANGNRRDYLQRARPVKNGKDFYWEVPLTQQRGLLGWLARNWGGAMAYSPDKRTTFQVPSHADFLASHRRDASLGWVRTHAA